ncbi:MAG: hypothetical protein WC707_02110 [Candidatus Babeliaceae bacterium]|jgi:hypothetical protein
MIRWLYIIFFIIISSCSSSVNTTTHNDVIQRLHKHIKEIVVVNKKIKKKFICVDLVIGNAYFQHDLVRWASRKIIEESSSSALVAIWDIFKYHNRPSNDNDFLFITDITKLIFLMYHSLLHELSQTSLKVSLYDIAQLYSQIAALPIKDLLDILDKFLSQLKAILHVYAPSPHESFYEWMSDHWWMPPVILASTGVTVWQWYLGKP